MSNFVELVSLASRGGSDEERKKNEARLIQMRQSYTEDFFLECGKALVNNDLDINTKRGVGTVMILSFKEKNNTDTKGFFWYKITDKLKLKLKACCLSLLIHPESSMMRMAAQALSIMFFLECVNGNWTDLLTNMITQCNSPKIPIKTSAITTLGFICEELAESKNKLSKSFCNQILTGICRGFGKGNTSEIVYRSLNALRNAMGYIYPVLDNDEYRNHVMGELVGILETETRSSENVVLSYQCIIEISSYFYREFDKYMSKIVSNTAKLLQCKIPDIVNVATEMWTAFANCELQIKKDLLSQNKSFTSLLGKFRNEIIPKVMLNLNKIDIDLADDDNLEKNIYSSSIRCLYAVNSLLSEELGGFNIEFIEKFIESSKPEAQIAALSVYAVHAQCNGIMKMGKMFSLSTKSLMRYLTTHKNLAVRVEVAKLFIVIARNHPQLLLTDNFMKPYLNDLLEIMKTHIRIAKKVYELFDTMVAKAKPRDLSNSFFLQEQERVVQNIIKSVINQNELKDTSYISRGFRTVIVIINKCFEYRHVQKFLPLFIEGVEKSSTAKKEVQSEILDSFLICIQMSLWKMYHIKGDISLRDLGVLYQKVKNLFYERKEVPLEGVMTLGTIGINMKEKVTQISEEMISFMKQSLDEKRNFEIVKTVLESISMVVRDIRGFTKNSMETVGFKLLIDAFEEPQFPQEYKGMLFTCLGDFSLLYFDIFVDHMVKFHSKYVQGFAATLHFINEKDPQMVEYGENLKECMIDSYLCVIHSFNSYQNNIEPHMFTAIKEFMDKLVKFIDQTLKKELNPTVEYVVNCLNLICDTSIINARQLGGIIKCATARQIYTQLDNLSQDKKTKDVEAVLSYFRKLENNR